METGVSLFREVAEATCAKTLPINCGRLRTRGKKQLGESVKVGAQHQMGRGVFFENGASSNV